MSENTEIQETNAELTAGQMLKQARTTGRRKRELNTLARTLCIKEDFLDALENDDFGRIPEMVYILGFARNYAMELELDPYLIVGKIKKQMGFLDEEDVVDVDGNNISDNLRSVGMGNFLRKNSRVLLMLMLGVILASGTAIAIITIQNMGAMIDAPVEAEAIEIVDKKFNLPIAREFGLRNRDYSTIALQATGTTWVQVKNSAGAVIFEQSMTEGDVYYALSGTTATIGNAGALDIWVNGREIPQLGAEHQRLLDVMLTADNLMGE